MATLWVREFSQVGAAGSWSNSPGNMPVALEPGTDQTPVTFTASAQSAAFATGTRYIIVIASAAFHYVVGANPTATTSALKIPADTPWAIAVEAGQKIAAIAAA